jgi:hypothetical protein
VELNSEYEGMEPIEIKALEKEEVVSETVPTKEQIKEEVAETISDISNPHLLLLLKFLKLRM